jgi:hypothetical protein
MLCVLAQFNKPGYTFTRKYTALQSISMCSSLVGILCFVDLLVVQKSP